MQRNRRWGGTRAWGHSPEGLTLPPEAVVSRWQLGPPSFSFWAGLLCQSWAVQGEQVGKLCPDSTPPPRQACACVPRGEHTHTHTHVRAHTGTHAVRSRSSAWVFLLPASIFLGHLPVERPHGQLVLETGPRARRLTGWTWSRSCSTAGRRSGGCTRRAGAPGRTSGSGPCRRRLKASSPASVTSRHPRKPRGNQGKPAVALQLLRREGSTAGHTDHAGYAVFTRSFLADSCKAGIFCFLC